MLICKKVLELKDKKIKNQQKKNGQKIWTENSQRKETQMALIHCKRWSALHRREMQIKPTLRYHFIPIRLAKIQSLTIHSCWGCGEASYTPKIGECKMVLPLWRAIWQFLLRLQMHQSSMHQFHSGNISYSWYLPQ